MEALPSRENKQLFETGPEIKVGVARSSPLPGNSTFQRLEARPCFDDPAVPHISYIKLCNNL